MAKIVTSRATPTRVRTPGEISVRELRANASSGRAMAASAAKVFRRRMLPLLKREVPVDTGALKRSLKIRQSGQFVDLRGEGYGRNVGVPDISVAILRRNRNAIHRDILNDLGGA